MTDISELVKRMRGLAEYVDDCDAAADALEAQAKRIAGLEYEARLFDEALGNAHARIAELEEGIRTINGASHALCNKKDARIAELEEALDTVVTFLEGNGGACLSNDDLVAVRAALKEEK